MKKLTKRWQILLYGCGAIGINMLNSIVGSYLCSALLTGGFVSNVENWTYLNKDLVVAGLWAVMVLIAKVVDGVIDLPMSSFTDNLKTRWGKRRPAMLIGWIPMVLSYVVFLFPLQSEATVLNTIWFAFWLCVFYSSYTLTMVTYYATFAEILDNEKDRVFLSSVKSVCDVVYFCISFALVPVFVNCGMNIRIVALLFLPLSLTVLIPLLLIKEAPTNTPEAKLERVQPVNLWKSIAHSFKSKDFLLWMLIHSVIFNIGLTVFLSGINEFFSTVGVGMTAVMASSFAPVPFTILIYNKFVRKRGIGFAYRYILAAFALGMGIMFFCNFLPETAKLPLAILCGVIVSFSIGGIFSIGYTIPSHIAAEENEKTGICSSSMFFAVQGLFEGVSAGVASGIILTWIKAHDSTVVEVGSFFETTRFASYIPLLCTVFSMVAFFLSYLLPKSISKLGMDQ